MAVVALDGGNPPKSGSILVDISVADVNDNAPVFDNDTYEVRLTNVLSLCGGHYYDTNSCGYLPCDFGIRLCSAAD